MMAIILKYCYCVCSGLLGIMGVVVQNSIELIRNTKFGSWVDE